LHNKTVVLLQY